MSLYDNSCLRDEDGNYLGTYPETNYSRFSDEVTRGGVSPELYARRRSESLIESDKMVARDYHARQNAMVRFGRVIAEEREEEFQWDKRLKWQKRTAELEASIARKNRLDEAANTFFHAFNYNTDNHNSTQYALEQVLNTVRRQRKYDQGAKARKAEHEKNNREFWDQVYKKFDANRADKIAPSWLDDDLSNRQCWSVEDSKGNITVVGEPTPVWCHPAQEYEPGYDLWATRADEPWFHIGNILKDTATSGWSELGRVIASGLCSHYRTYGDKGFNEPIPVTFEGI